MTFTVRKRDHHLHDNIYNHTPDINRHYNKLRSQGIPRRDGGYWTYGRTKIEDNIARAYIKTYTRCKEEESITCEGDCFS